LDEDFKDFKPNGHFRSKLLLELIRCHDEEIPSHLLPYE
jgi:hypothetical protein